MQTLNRRLPVVLTAIVACLAAAPARAAVPADAPVRAMLARRVDVQQQAVGIIVGIVTPAGTRYVSYGSVGGGGQRAPDRHTVFEIASVGKLFTALLLADLATRGELSLDDPVSKYLPSALVTVPRYGDRDITLFDLASHTSGLPLRPPNLGSQTQLDKYAAYTVEQLYRGISEFRLARAPGSAFEYSNVGYGLLGNALGRYTGRSYEAMVLERITRPLGLTETREALTPAMRRREAVGHLPDLTPGIFEGAGALEGAGSLHSTAADLARLLRGFMGLRPSPLRAAMSAMTARLRPTDEAATQVGLGWRVTTLDGHTIVWSNGRADGFRAFIGYSTATRVGVVALANVGSDAGADDIAEHLIDPYFPVNLQGPDDHHEITLPRAALARFVGSFRFDDQSVMTIRQDGSLLVAQFSGQQGRFALHAEAPAGFFLREADAQASFEGADGEPAQWLVWHQNGHHDRARRIP